MRLWGKWFGNKTANADLRPPVSRRLKTYSAESGYVYQYRSLGSRPGRDGMEYLFEICRDRARWLIATVYLPGDVAEHWELGAGRELTSSEKFGLAKTKLVWSLDEAEMPLNESFQVSMSLSDLERAAEHLGL